MKTDLETAVIFDNIFFQYSTERYILRHSNDKTLVVNTNNATFEI